MKKNRTTKDRAAFEYALYMIVSSYFDKADCSTGIMERNLLLHYKEQKIRKQYEMEDYCIRFMDNLEQRLGTKFFSGKATVRLVRAHENNPVSIIFRGEGRELVLSVVYTGRRKEIRFKVRSVAAC